MRYQNEVSSCESRDQGKMLFGKVFVWLLDQHADIVYKVNIPTNSWKLSLFQCVVVGLYKGCLKSCNNDPLWRQLEQGAFNAVLMSALSSSSLSQCRRSTVVFFRDNIL